MDVEFFAARGMSEEERAVLSTVSEFRSKEIEKVACEIDEKPEAQTIAGLFKKASSLGMASCLDVEKGDGGTAGVMTMCISLKEISRSSAGFAALLLSHNVALRGLAASGAGIDVEEFASGEKRAAFAYAESTTDERLEAGMVPGGLGADAVVFYAPGEETVWVLEGEAAGRAVWPFRDPLGLRSSLLAAAALDRSGGVAVPLRPGGEEMDFLRASLLIGVTSIACGITVRAFETAFSYAKGRYQGGDFIINHQQVRAFLAEMVAGIHVANSLIESAALALGEGGLPLGLCLAAKMTSARIAYESSLNCVQIHGGYGYMRDYGAERLLRDAKYCQVYPEPEVDSALDILDSLGF